jgi:16S rRNA (cytosine1402-N4)-methyltransferase
MKWIKSDLNAYKVVNEYDDVNLKSVLRHGELKSACAQSLKQELHNKTTDEKKCLLSFAWKVGIKYWQIYQYN